MKHDIEFEVGQVVVYKPYEKAIPMYVTKVDTKMRGFMRKPEDDPRVFYTLSKHESDCATGDGTSVSTGLCIAESKYFDHKNQLFREGDKVVMVTMIDTFMSDWGPAKGMNNRLYLIANDDSEKRAILSHAHKRGDMTKIVVIDRVAGQDFSLKRLNELGGGESISWIHDVPGGKNEYRQLMPKSKMQAWYKESGS